jgi:protein gp37
LGKNSKIEWTHHTFNPWWGCTKVSAACAHCYAEAWAKRVGLKVWGVSSPRRFFGEDHWRQPLHWNRQAQRAGVRRRVFCASMADVFEVRPELDPWRARLWELIEATPHLDWLLLTKRPERVAQFVPWRGHWPDNVWLGTTVESQYWAERRIPMLAACPAKMRFLSCEPLLAPVDLRRWLGNAVHWIIAGGESGPGARPTHPKWLRDLRDQCVGSGVPFHFKQWGNWTPLSNRCANASCTMFRLGDGDTMVRSSKKQSGRLLDGETWDQAPAR